MKSAFYGVRTSVLVPLLGFLAFVLCTGLALADTEQHNEFEGSIDAVFYDAPLNQLQVNGWAWDTVTALPAAKLRISVRGHDYQANSLSRIARKDVATARAIPVLETGFSSTIALSEALPGGLHPVEVTAIFSDDRSVRLLSWSGETPRVPVDKPRSRHWILLALVLGWIALAYVPRLRQWGDRAGNWVKTHPHRISTAIGATFLLLVAFGITGSSLQLLSQGPQGPFGLGAMEFKGSSARIFKPRDLRSDEWGVLTPNALAQWQHNPPFPVVNTNLGLEGQNMGVIGMTGAPIAQPAALARPATWGYFLLPLRQALSWHWQLPFFACLFFLWKALNLLRPRTPGFNLALAATFCVAPYAAAWSLWPLYAAFFPLALFVTTAAALRTGSVAKTLPLGAAMGLLLAGWVLVLYPPWQITVGTFFVALTIGWVADHRHELQFRKAQWLCIGLALLIAAALVGSWWLDTADAVEQMRATIYPGSRNVLQGGEIGNLWALRGYTNPETLTFGVGPHTNQSEISSYILFPLPILLLGLLHCKRTSSGRWTVRACMAFIAFWIVFRFFGVPLWLAKITLWSYVPSGRLDLAIGLACTVLMALIHTDRQPHAPNSRARLPLLTALCVAAGEDDVGETLDLLACHLIGGFADSCGAVPGTAGDGDKNIGPRPGVFVPDGAELVKADLELRGAVLQRRAFLQLSAFVSTAQSDEFRAGAVEPIIESPELQPSQEALDPCDVVVVLRTDEQMHVDEAALCRDVQTQLDVREDKLDVRQASLLPTPAEHFFIGVGYVVVRNGDGFDLGRGRLQGGQTVGHGLPQG